MKYENAGDILPASLLKEVQKYAEGKMIYVPKKAQAKGWGEASGYRDRLKKRNAMICSRYSAGQSIMEIAEEFYLSPETIKKLVYGKKVKIPVFSPSITAAKKYAAAGMGEEWVRMYLNSLNEEMPDLSDIFMSELVKIPLRLSTNKEEKRTLDEERNFLEIPLLVFYKNKKFEVPFQADYLAYLKAQKMNSQYAFVFTDNEDYRFFWNNFGKHFQR